MTRETKIGLLVGLAFIILFAIILSEKGANPRQAAVPRFTTGETKFASNRPSGDGLDSALADAGRMNIERSLPGVERPADPVDRSTPPIQAVPVHTADAQSAGSALPVVPEESLVELVDRGRREVADRPATPTAPRVADAAGQAEPPRTGSPELVEGPPAPTLENLIDNLPTFPKPGADSSLSTPPAKTGETVVVRGPAGDEPTGPAVKSARTYVVQSGDTLSRIARKMYGSSKPSLVENIYRANRSTMKDRHSVKLGQSLVIPEVVALASTADSRRPATGPAVSTTPLIPRAADSASPATVVVDRARPDAGPGPILTKSDSTRRTPMRDPLGIKKSGAERRENPIEPTVAQAAKTRAAPPRSYTVRPRDTLSRIARQQLGDERRVAELYKLNRGLLKNRDKLKPGMKLRLPGDKPTSKPQTRNSSGQGELEAAGSSA